MAKLFKVIVTTTPVPVEPTTREVNVVAETQEEASTKVVLTEGEAVTEVTDSGEVIA